MFKKARNVLLFFACSPAIKDLLPFFQKHLAIKGYSKTSIAEYPKRIRRICSESGITNMAQLTPENIRNFFDKKNWTNATKKQRAVNLKLFTKFLYDEGHYRKDALKDLSIKSYSEKGSHRYVPKVCMKSIGLFMHNVFQGTGHTDISRLMAQFIISTGARRAEVCSIKYKDIIPTEEGLIIKIQGKGHKQRFLSSVDKGLVKVLLDMKSRNSQEARLFNVRYSMVSERLKKVTEKSIGHSLTAHQLRHICARRMQFLGVDAIDIKRTLGHSDFRTTEIYLSSNINEHMERISNKMNKKQRISEKLAA